MFAAAVSLLAAPAVPARPLAAQEPAAAVPFEPAPTARTTQGVTLEQAISMAQGRFRGRVVRAQTTTRGGRAVHEIRILGEDGRVRNVRIDAQSGRFL